MIAISPTRATLKALHAGGVWTLVDVSIAEARWSVIGDPVCCPGCDTMHAFFVVRERFTVPGYRWSVRCVGCDLGADS